MSGIRICLIAGLMLTAGCANEPAVVSKVPDEQTAIAIAKKRCDHEAPPTRYEKWYAALHQGIWHVWMSLEPGAQDEPQQGGDPEHDYLDIRIRASDGKDGGCGMMVG